MLSIVLPCYFEEANVEFIYTRILEALDDREDMELIYVDDGSGDRTFEAIRNLSASDSRVRGIRFSRNFGHQVALLAGLKEAKGDLVITMDADGQHPASMIPELLAKQREGFEIVNTRRTDHNKTGPFKKSSSRWFYSFLNRVSEVRIEPAAADFRLMTRKALDAFLEIDEHDRFTRGLIGWMGFEQAVIPYTAAERHAGNTKYTFRKMRHFAFDGITSFSSRPLRMSMYMGSVVIVFAILYSIYALVVHFTGNTNPGWTSLLITMLLLGGIQLFTIGIIGEYIARIFNEVKGRPHYFISDRT
jgi:dolichol-phosphate mannosyltransferase